MSACVCVWAWFTNWADETSSRFIITAVPEPPMNASLFSQTTRGYTLQTAQIPAWINLTLDIVQVHECSLTLDMCVSRFIKRNVSIPCCNVTVCVFDNMLLPKNCMQTHALSFYALQSFNVVFLWSQISCCSKWPCVFHDIIREDCRLSQWERMMLVFWTGPVTMTSDNELNSCRHVLNLFLPDVRFFLTILLII